MKEYKMAGYNAGETGAPEETIMNIEHIKAKNKQEAKKKYIKKHGTYLDPIFIE